MERRYGALLILFAIPLNASANALYYSFRERADFMRALYTPNATKGTLAWNLKRLLTKFWNLFWEMKGQNLLSVSTLSKRAYKQGATRSSRSDVSLRAIL